MKQILLLIVAVLSLTASAYDFIEDGIAYDINADGNSVTVTYQTYSYPSYPNASGPLTIPSTVTHEGKAYTVTAIGYYAFAGCSGFTGPLNIPSSVTEIGGSSFFSCSGLTGSLTIPESVTSIGWDAFAYCYNFTAINNHINHPSDVSLGTKVFFEVPKGNCILYVPIGRVEEYREAAQWNDFLNILEGDWGERINGDVNGDGVVDVDDVNALISVILGKSSPEDYTGEVNVDGQGAVDIDDVHYVISIILEKR